MKPQKEAALARSLEGSAAELLRKMTKILAEAGFPDVQVESFEVRRTGGLATALETLVEECPTRCVVMPDNSIRCFPDCG